MIYKKRPPKIKLSALQEARVKSALEKKDRIFESAHDIGGGQIVILCYRVLDNGQKSHGQYDLSELL